MADFSSSVLKYFSRKLDMDDGSSQESFGSTLVSNSTNSRASGSSRRSIVSSSSSHNDLFLPRIALHDGPGRSAELVVDLRA